MRDRNFNIGCFNFATLWMRSVLTGVLFLSSLNALSAQEEGASAERRPTDDVPALTEEVIDFADPHSAALKEVEAYLGRLTSLRAHFTQSNPDGSKAGGILSLERPGRIRFDYKPEAPFLVVSDGRVLSFVDYEVGQVTRWPVNDTPLRLLLGDISDLAAFGAQIKLNPSGLEDYIALRARDPDRPELGLISIFFQKQPGGLELVSWLVEDAQGQVTFVELSAQEKDIELADALWTFEDPRGRSKRRTHR